MCGICGIIAPSGADDTDRSAIGRIAASLAHRGPDDLQTHIEQHALLGHTRLSIVDIAGGAQPMPNEDSTVHVVFNGEIYNFLELKEILVSKGHVFQTRSDTEVIVHGFEEFGESIVERLDGMFAFAAWDSRSRKLLLARDRTGKKPLYFTEASGRLIFASEIKAILLHPLSRRALDSQSLHHSISFQNVPGDRTMFDGILKLRPAHYALVGDTLEVNQRRYWFPENIETAADETKWSRTIDELPSMLERAVSARLMGDVPVGAFLSGGVDSSAVVALMSKCATGKISTFSIGFDQAEYDETSFARAVASKFGTEHTEFTVTSSELMSSVSKILWHCDEPVADSSILPTYYLSKMTSAHVKVALSGDGGDELFGGYERYVADRYLHSLDSIPAGFRLSVLSPLFGAATAVSPSSKLKHRFGQLSSFVRMSAAERHLNWLAFFTETEKASLFTTKFAETASGTPSHELMEDLHKLSSGKGRDYTSVQLLADFLSYLPETLMMKVDRASMACGLEVRCPILDTRVAAAGISIPGSVRIRDNVTKWALKRAVAPLLPDDIINRRKKGFEVPLDAWFRGPLREPLNDILADNTARQRGIFSYDTVSRLLKEHESGEKKHGHKLWALLAVELWHRLFIDGAAPDSPKEFF